jgi:CheY-like chemotaxis protein
VPPKILCVEVDYFLRESRCNLLHVSGYDTLSASPQSAEIVLRSHRFDLIILSSPNEADLYRIINLSDGAEVLVLDESVMPPELLTMLAHRLKRQRRA